jgi:CheY-like chemotaxis protein/two-component sensor histidine kinase
VLGVVLANAGLLRNAIPPEHEELLADVAEVEGAARRGASMIGKLMSFSRQAPLEVGTVELGGLVERVLETLRRLLPTHIAVSADRVPVPVFVRADPVAVEQILLNLATNARDAMPAGGSLRVRVSAVTLREGDGVAGGDFGCFTVADDGVGMSEDVRARVFEPFFTTKPSSQGTGLGMAMVYGLVRQQGGTIALRSSPGAGTTVRVCLPAVGSPEPSVSLAPARDEWPGGTETVLFVEDEAPLRRAGTRILSRLGYTVLTAGDGEEALEIIRRDGQTIDLIVSDIVMPRLSGRGLYERLKDERRRVRFLFSSGYGGEEIEALGGEDGAAPLLRKPWSAAELATKIRELLDQPL